MFVSMWTLEFQRLKFKNQDQKCNSELVLERLTFSPDCACVHVVD